VPISFTLDDLEKLKVKVTILDSKYLKTVTDTTLDPREDLFESSHLVAEFCWHSSTLAQLAQSDLTLDDLDGSKTKVTVFDVKYVENGKSYDVGLNGGYVDSSSLDLLSKIFGLLVGIFWLFAYLRHLVCFWVNCGILYRFLFIIINGSNNNKET